MNLSGKVALVTGGASGLGRATTAKLLDAGASVVIADLPNSEGDAAARALGERSVFAAIDVTSAEDVGSAVRTAVAHFGGLHVAVNCAGIATPGRILRRDGSPLDLGVFERVVRVNLVGTFNVIRLASAQMASQEPDGEERGVIVNTASVAAFEGQIGQAAYSASKGGVVSLTLTAARDLAGMRIRVAAIAPGTFDTPMMAGLGDEVRAKLAAKTPHPNRLGKPDEYALLVSQIIANPMINGTTIRLDGALRLAPR